MVSTPQSAPFSPEIDRQLDGYWVSPRDVIPANRPAYRPTGAVLPRIGAQTDRDFVGLDLVSIEYAWFPLSEAGRYTYAHSEGLLRGEAWRFVVWQEGRQTVYSVEYDASIAPALVAPLYGIEAAQRCRPDRPAVQLRVRINNGA